MVDYLGFTCKFCRKLATFCALGNAIVLSFCRLLAPCTCLYLHNTWHLHRNKLLPPLNSGHYANGTWVGVPLRPSLHCTYSIQHGKFMPIFQGCRFPKNMTLPIPWKILLLRMGLNGLGPRQAIWTVDTTAI